MKITRMEGRGFHFRLGRKEKNVFLGLLTLYPVAPTAPRGGPAKGGQEASQDLLEEALTEQRSENRRLVERFLARAAEGRAAEAALEFDLGEGEVEWLLQVLNDVRVGSWIHLGSPEEGERVWSAAHARHIWAMEMAGYFQMQVLDQLA